VPVSQPNVIYVGSGEGLHRPDLSVGDGIYKSTDGGKTWTHLGLRDGQQIAQFGKSVDEKLAAVRNYLPDDLIIARTSDQPLQVKENLNLFMGALYEAIVLVVIVSLIGFWEWRSAVLMAISIPITLAMTFGMMYMLGIDIQQVSIATLIIALGLLVDDPVVAGDSIKRGLAEGHPSIVASWLGPTKLAKAIMFATITNIAAYIPFLLLTGTMGAALIAVAAATYLMAVGHDGASWVGYVLAGLVTAAMPAVEWLHVRQLRGVAAEHHPTATPPVA